MGDGKIVEGGKDLVKGGGDIGSGAGDISTSKDKAGAGGQHITNGLAGMNNASK